MAESNRCLHGVAGGSSLLTRPQLTRHDAKITRDTDPLLRAAVGATIEAATGRKSAGNIFGPKSAWPGRTYS